MTIALAPRLRLLAEAGVRVASLDLGQAAGGLACRSAPERLPSD